MVKSKGLFLFLFLWFIPSLLLAGSSVNLITSSEEEVIVKISISHFECKKIKAEETLYHCITVAGWGRTEVTGSPQLPMRGIMVGIPTKGMVKAEVIDGNEEELSNLNIYPCPQKIVEEKKGEIFLKEVFYSDKEAYSRNSYIPGKCVEVSETGYMRNQRYAKINIYPFQYNPVKKKLKVCREMLIRVSFQGKRIGPLTYSKKEICYERMLEKLLVNYKSLGRFESEGERKGEYVTRKTEVNEIADLKLHLNGEGIYKIGYSDLSSLWQIETIDPRKIHLKHLGTEIPIFFPGEGDGSFDPSDYFLFYAPPFKSEYTKDDVYWLSVGSINGSRMGSVDGGVGTGTLLPSFTNLYHGEEDDVYWQSIPDGEGKDHWFWNRLIVPNPPAPVSYTINFILNNILNTSSDCTLKFNFRGRTNDSVNPDHHTRLFINGQTVAEDWWDGQIELERTVTFPQSYLIEGENKLTVRSVGDTGASPYQSGYNQYGDVVHFNWFDLTYQDTYVAEGDFLKFKGEGSGDYEMDISGFSSSDIFLFDITDSVHPRKVINFTIFPGYAIKFEDTISGTKEYMAVTLGGMNGPTLIEADTTSHLKDASNGADYIIIIYDGFYEAIRPLADYRALQGKRVMLVKVGDVYDEFSYGMSDPQAIQDFLKYAYENYQKPAPLYVLLVGDADMDYLDNFYNDSQGSKNYVPTYLYQTAELGDTPTDNWFACVSGNDILPDLYIGRISVRTAAEVTRAVNKIMSYENAPVENWNTKALFVSDNDDIIFEEIPETLITNYLPPDFEPHRVYLSEYSSVSACKTDLMNNINEGRLITVYTGHGNVSNWAGEYIFQSSDVGNLTNSGMPSFVITLTCLNGFFSHPTSAYCLAEELVRAEDKGAIACFSPTSLGYPWEHNYLGQEVFNDIFNENGYLIGNVVTSAKIEAYTHHGTTSDLVQTYTLFGDPGTLLHYSSNKPPVLTPIGDKEVNEGTLLQFTISATDPNGEELTYSASNLPNGSSFNPVTHVFRWVPASGQAGIYTGVRFTVTDNGTPQASNSEDITISVRTTTVIELSSFAAYPYDGIIFIEWSTESEIDNEGFNLYRASAKDGPYTLINDTLILANGSSVKGSSYIFVDEDVQNRETYFYKLEDIDIYGMSTFHGPISATPKKIYGIGDR